MLILRLILLILLISKTAIAQEKKPGIEERGTGEAVSFSLDNDSRLLGGPGSDNAYSAGFKMSYVYALDKLPRWSKPTLGLLPFVKVKMDSSRFNYGVSLAQQIYTPNDKDVRELIITDRPYAAWLYVGLFFSVKEPTQSHLLELDLGAVGPVAQGEHFQNTVHSALGINKASGWEHQLKNEPTLQLSYVQKIKTFDLHTARRTYFDLIPEFGLSLGNVLIGARTGLVARLGTNLPDNFGPSRPSASDGESFVSTGKEKQDPQSNFYFFGALRGNAIGRDIFLDGNNYQKSHRVRRRPLTFETDLGFCVQYFPWNFVWRFTTKSPEFYEREKPNSFASVNLSYHIGM